MNIIICIVFIIILPICVLPAYAEGADSFYNDPFSVSHGIPFDMSAQDI